MTSSNALSRVVVLLLVTVVVFLLLASRVHAGSEVRPTEIHVVTSGETLWELAEPMTVPGKDIRVVIEDIKRLNGLTDSWIAAGDRLILPVGGSR